MKRTLSALVLLVIGCVLAAQAQVFLAAGTEFVLVAAQPLTPPAMLPPDPISPSPSVELNFEANTFISCANTASCVADVRAGSEVGYWRTGPLAMTTFPTNTPVVTDYGLHRANAGTNILLNSENLAGVGWGFQNGTFTSNAAIGPDGNMNAALFSDNVNSAGFNAHTVYNTSFSVVAGTSYTFSALVKGLSARYVQFAPNYLQFGGATYANFSLQSCSVVGTGSNFTSTDTVISPLAGARPLANGWCQIWFKAIATVTAASQVQIPIVPYGQAVYDQQYIGTGDQILLTKVDVKAGNLTPYCVTTSAPALCNSDNLTATGALLSVESGSQGYVVANLNKVPFPTNSYILSRNDTTDAFLMLSAGGLSTNARIAGTNVAIAASGGTPGVQGGVSNLGSAWNGSGIKTIMNGGAVTNLATPFGGTINATIGNGSDIDIRRIFAGTTEPSDAGMLAFVPLEGAPIPPSVTAYYFSGTGSDANPCTLLLPCQTIIKINSFTNLVFGNTINLDAATPFVGCMHITPTQVLVSNPSVPIVIQPYNGSQFTLTSNCSGDASGEATSVGAININSVSGVTVQDCIIRGPGGAQTPYAGVWITNFGAGQVDTVTVQRCDIANFLRYPGQVGSFSDIGVTSNHSSAGMTNIQILNNTLHGLTGPSDTDTNGIQGFGNGINLFNVLYQGNLMFNHGYQPNDVPGPGGNGIVFGGIGAGSIGQFNIAHDNGGNSNTCGGPVAFESSVSSSFIVRMNEAYNEGPVTFTAGCDWAGLDPDIGTFNSIWEYNYVHENFGNGMLNFAGAGGGFNWQNNVGRYNIFENNASNAGVLAATSEIVYVFGYSAPGQVLYNNTIWNGVLNVTPCVIWAFGYNTGTTATGLVANNICVKANSGVNTFLWNDNGGATYLPVGIVFRSNDYRLAVGGATALWHVNDMFTTPSPTTLAAWQAIASNGSPGDVGASVANPLLTGTPPFGNCTWTPSINNGPQSVGCPGTYVLQAGSTMKSAGTDLQGGGFITGSPGTQDYFNNTIPGTGMCWNIGADGKCP